MCSVPGVSAAWPVLRRRGAFSPRNRFWIPWNSMAPDDIEVEDDRSVRERHELYDFKMLKRC